MNKPTKPSTDFSPRKFIPLVQIHIRDYAKYASKLPKCLCGVKPLPIYALRYCPIGSPGSLPKYGRLRDVFGLFCPDCGNSTPLFSGFPDAFHAWHELNEVPSPYEHRPRHPETSSPSA